MAERDGHDTYVHGQCTTPRPLSKYLFKCTQQEARNQQASFTTFITHGLPRTVTSQIDEFFEN